MILYDIEVLQFWIPPGRCITWEMGGSQFTKTLCTGLSQTTKNDNGDCPHSRFPGFATIPCTGSWWTGTPPNLQDGGRCRIRPWRNTEYVPGRQFAIFIQVSNRGRFCQYISLPMKYTVSGSTLQYKVGLTLSFLSLISRGVGGIQKGNTSIYTVPYSTTGTVCFILYSTVPSTVLSVQ